MREARTRAGLSQEEMARRAAVTQSVISAYESGRRQPSFPTLHRLIEATGHVVRAEVVPAPAAPLSGPLGVRIRERRTELLTAAADYGVRNLRVFGSVARGVERPDSDVDIAADLPPDLGLVGLGRLEQEMTRILDARVDLVPADDLKALVGRAVDVEGVPV